MKHVSIIFPASFRDFTKPNLLPAKLAGFLKEKKVQVNQWDLNMAWIHYLLSEVGILRLKRECNQIFHILDQKEILNPVEQKVFLTISWMAVISEETLVKEAERVLSVFKGEEFFKFLRLHKANQFLTRLLDVANIILVDSKTGMTFNPFISFREIKRIIESDTLHHEFFAKQLSTKSIGQLNYVIIALVSNAQILDACILAKEIKKQAPELNVIITGHPLTILKDEFKKHKEFFQWFDYLVYGDMEFPLLFLIESQNISSIPNIIYQNTFGEIVENCQASWEITEYGDVDFSGVDLNQYLSPLRVLPLYASKGCIWGRCNFCSIHKSANQYEEREMDQIIANLKHLKSTYDVSVFYFPDEALSPQMLKELSNRLMEEKLGIYWTAQTRFSNELTYEVLQEVADAGCIHLEFGLESADKKTLVRMDKGITLEMVRRNLQDAKRAHLIKTVNIMIGYPGDLNPGTTLKFLIENKDYIDRVTNFAFFVTRGSELEKRCEEYGINIDRTEWNDLQLAYTDYKLITGLDWKEKENQITEINKIINSYSDAFISNPYPILEYCVFYQTRDVKEIEVLSEGCRVESMRLLKNSITKHPSKKSGIEIIELPFNHYEIRKAYKYRLAGNLALKEIQPVSSKPIKLVFDTLEDNTYKVPEKVLWLIERSDGIKHVEDLAKEYSTEHNLPFEQGLKIVEIYLMVYQFLFR